MEPHERVGLDRIGCSMYGLQATRRPRAESVELIRLDEARRTGLIQLGTAMPTMAFLSSTYTRLARAPSFGYPVDPGVSWMQSKGRQSIGTCSLCRRIPWSSVGRSYKASTAPYLSLSVYQASVSVNRKVVYCHLYPSFAEMALKSFTCFAIPALLASSATAAPISQAQLADPTFGPIPGESTTYSDGYFGVAPPFPGNITDPIYPSVSGPPGTDDLLWQNLLSAEWVIFSFYQQGVELFNTSTFTALGAPNTTYQRIQEIRNNEAGHLRLFQNQISATSIKPGPCKYEFPITSAQSFLALATVIEISSMAFLTGLVQQAQLNASKGALTAVAETESRHNTWTLIDIWNVDPFAGPSDTSFPYANQILDTTNSFVVPGSCPPANPQYPYPSQNLPTLTAAQGTTSLVPGSTIGLNFSNPLNQPTFAPSQQYYAVFFHGLTNVSVPLDTTGWTPDGDKTIEVTIPAAFETKGVIVAVVADTVGAPTMDTVVAGPGIILEQPTEIAVALAT